MKTYAVVGTCPVCSQGRLIIARENASGALYVLCEECESEWPSPATCADINAATRDVFGASTLLERDALVGHEWEAALQD